MTDEQRTSPGQPSEHPDQHVLARIARGARIGAVQPLRWYLRRAPHRRGRYRLMQWGRAVLGSEPVHATSVDGRRFVLKFPQDGGWECLYFIGDFETGTTRLLRQILQPSDVVLDVGANIGWFTTLAAALCTHGHCHAFELNCFLNGAERNVTLNNLALGDHTGDGWLYSFRDRPPVYNSMSPRAGPEGTGVECSVTTIDDYVDRNRLELVHLVKVDVEGAELQVLSGADSLISNPSAPMWLVEVNKRTSQAFGYEPEAIFARLQDRDEYRFLRVLGGWGAVVPMQAPAECEHADNVLCVPRAHWGRISRLQGLGADKRT